MIDCSSRALVPLMALPHVAAVATGDDIESVRRVITVLTAELDRRRPLLTDLDVQAENLSAYLDKGHSMPRIVVLVDGFQNLPAILGVARPSENGPARLGRRVPAHRDRRPPARHPRRDRRRPPPSDPAAPDVGDRQPPAPRQTDDGGYVDYGIPARMSKGLELPNGRGLRDNRLVQVGLVSEVPSAAAQGAAIAAFAAGLGDMQPTSLHSSPPPDTVTVPLRAQDPESFTLGTDRCVRGADRGQRPLQRAVRHRAARSGRTTALRQAAVRWWPPDTRCGPWGSATASACGPGRHTSAKSDAMLGLVEEFATLCETFPASGPFVLVVDDVDRYELSALDSAYDRILKTETSRLIGSIETRNMGGYTPSTMLSEVRREPTLLFLQPDGASEILQHVGVRPNLRPGFKLSAGRGVLIMDRQAHVVLVASATE